MRILNFIKTIKSVIRRELVGQIWNPQMLRKYREQRGQTFIKS